MAGVNSEPGATAVPEGRSPAGQLRPGQKPWEQNRGDREEKASVAGDTLICIPFLLYYTL